MSLKETNLKKNKITMKKLKKQVQGITLISLVVTIIVLLILAGVAINLSIGDNGIFKRAQDTSKISKEASAEERIKLEVLGSLDDTGKYNRETLMSNLKNKLKAKVELNDKNNTLKVTYEGFDFLIDKNR